MSGVFFNYLGHSGALSFLQPFVNAFFRFYFIVYSTAVLITSNFQMDEESESMLVPCQHVLHLMASGDGA